MGGRGVQGSEGRGPGDRVRLERQRHAAGARVPPAVGRSLQSRSQELRRPPLSRARRTAGADSRHASGGCTRWVLGRDRHAADPRLQRLARRADAADRVHRQRLARHSVARHRVSRRLQDDRPAEHHGGDAARRGRDRPRQRAALHLRRQPAGPGRRSRRHALRGVRRDCSSRATAITSATTASRRRPLPGLRHGGSRALERAASTARSPRGRSCPDRGHDLPALQF